MYNFIVMKSGNKKSFVYKSDLLSQEATLTVDDNLNKLKGKILAPRKLAAANRSLGKLRNSLPK